MPKELLISHESEFVTRVESQWKQSNLIPLKNALDDSFSAETLMLFDKLMYSIGSSEVKQVIFLNGLTQTEMQVSDIYRNITGELEPETWFPDKNLILTHLGKSFIPTGLVNKENNNYCFSDSGEVIGKTSAATMLNYSFDTGVNTSTVFGKPTTTSNNRAYITRSAILLNLLKGDSHEIKICRDLSIDLSAVRGGLKALSKNGLIIHTFGGTETGGENVYQKSGEAELVEHKPRGNLLRRNIVDYFSINNDGNPQGIAEALGRRDVSEIYGILSELVDSGFIKRSTWHAGVKQSDTKITEKGKDFVAKVVKPILDICSFDDKAITEAQEIIARCYQNPKIVSEVLTNYQISVAETDNETKMGQVLEYIKEYGTKTTGEIKNELGGKNLPVLKILVELGQLVKYQEGKNSFYGLPGVEKPMFDKKTNIVGYEQPKNLLINEAKPKEFYLNQLESVVFWNEIKSDLENLGEIKCTEKDFFTFYDNENQNWMEKSDKTLGKYAKVLFALKRLEIEHPCSYIRGYLPKDDSLDLSLTIQRVQSLIEEKLIRTKDIKNWQYYQETLNSEKFWVELDNDLDQIDDGTFISSFMMWFKRNAQNNIIYPRPRGDYFRFYTAISKHIETPNQYLMDYKPIYTDGSVLEELVLSVQTKMQKKLRFMREATYPKGWVEMFESDSFWQAFDKDLKNYSGKNRSFRTFLYRYTDSNTNLKDNCLGKYYRLVESVSRHTQYFYDQPTLRDIPNEIKSGVVAAIKLNFYFKSPIEVRDRLVALFPKDFNFAFEPFDEKDNMLYFMSSLPDMTNQEQLFLLELNSQIREKIDYADELVNMERELKGPSATIWSGIQSYPVLSNEEQKSMAVTYEHAKRAKRILEICEDHPSKFKIREIIDKGEIAKDYLIKSNQRLVLFFANKFDSDDTDVYDLYQVGNLALINAIETYDWRKGVKLSTFAGNTMKWYMLTSRGSMKGMSTNTYNQLQKVLKAKDLIEKETGVSADFSEIAIRSGISVERVENLIKSTKTISLESKFSGTDKEAKEFGNSVPDKNVNVESQIIRKVLNEKLSNLINSGIISKRQSEIIQMRYGMTDGHCYSYGEIGKNLTINVDLVKRLELDALNELRNNDQIKNIKNDFFEN